MNGAGPILLDQMTSLAEPIRSRMLLLLDRRELSVSELCQILQLPQSTVSRHLKTLVEAGWIVSRADGTSHLYTMLRAGQGGQDGQGDAARRLWLLVREQVGSMPAAAQDQHRLQAVVAERRTRSQEFFASSAGRWDRLRDELFGERFHLAALAAFADREWTVGDLGCGTGQTSVALAPFVRRVIAVDTSAAMLQAARERLEGFDTVELRRGELEALPVDDDQLDAATLMLVLHHVPEPARALAEVGRVVKPGGRLVIVDMLPHDRESYRRQMGHVWLGFGREQLNALLGDAGFACTNVVPLTPDAQAKGPALFVATTIRQA